MKGSDGIPVFTGGTLARPFRKFIAAVVTDIDSFFVGHIFSIQCLLIGKKGYFKVIHKKYFLCMEERLGWCKGKIDSVFNYRMKVKRGCFNITG